MGRIANAKSKIEVPASRQNRDFVSKNTKICLTSTYDGWFESEKCLPTL